METHLQAYTLCVVCPPNLSLCDCGQLSHCGGFTPPEQPQPKEQCESLQEVRWPPSTPDYKVISSCAICIHYILIHKHTKQHKGGSHWPIKSMYYSPFTGLESPWRLPWAKRRPADCDPPGVCYDRLGEERGVAIKKGMRSCSPRGLFSYVSPPLLYTPGGTPACTPKSVSTLCNPLCWFWKQLSAFVSVRFMKAAPALQSEALLTRTYSSISDLISFSPFVLLFLLCLCDLKTKWVILWLTRPPLDKVWDSISPQWCFQG